MPYPRVLEKTLDFIMEGMWTESLRLFFSYWRSWVAGLLLFSLLSAAVDYLGAHYPLATLAYYGFVIPVELYFFCVCFLNQEPISGAVTPTLRQFIRAYSYLFLIPVCALVFGSGAFHPLYDGVHLFGPDLAPLSLMIIYGGLWLLTRLVLALPLSVNQIAHPLKKSWEITQDKALRLLVNYFALMLITSPLNLLYTDTMPVINGLILTIEVCLGSAFLCASARILYGENIASHLTHDRRAAAREA